MSFSPSPPTGLFSRRVDKYSPDRCDKFKNITVYSTKTKIINSDIFNDENGRPYSFTEVSTETFEIMTKIIIKDNDGKSKKKLEKMKPLILDYLPLTLEEVFIYEMEALGYEFNKFV